MPLSKEHLKRNPEDRNVGNSPVNGGTSLAQFNRSDALLQECLCDIVNGYTKNDIILKFKNKEYTNQKKAIGERQASNYIKMAYLIMADNRVKEQDRLRDEFYEKYTALYNDAMINGNTLLAKTILDSMTKTFLPEEKNINLNGSLDNKVTINFGFEDNGGEV